LNFLDKVSKNTQELNVMKIRSVETKFYHADRRTEGRTWRTNSPFWQFCERA